jgi:hypothetical protein
VSDGQLGAQVTPGPTAVAVAVVGQDPFDVDALFGEPRDRPVEEGDTVGGLLGAGELAVGQPRLRVDGGADVGVAALGPVGSLHCLGAAAELAVPAAFGDPGQSLDINVDQSL